MIRRALLITATAVALSAAGALAVAPGFAHAPHHWSLRPWSSSGFTPVPRAKDTSAVTRVPPTTEGAIPGTYCPVKPRDGKSRLGEDTLLDLGAISGQSKADTGSAAAAMCPTPKAASQRPILP
jgi:hypothetical protein